MPDIDLGLGLKAEMNGDEITLTDEFAVDDPITLSLDQFDLLAGWVALNRQDKGLK